MGRTVLHLEDGSAPRAGGQCVAGTGHQKIVYSTEQVGGVSCGEAACKELWAASKMLLLLLLLSHFSCVQLCVTP